MISRELHRKSETRNLQTQIRNLITPKLQYNAQDIPRSGTPVAFLIGSAIYRLHPWNIYTVRSPKRHGNSDIQLHARTHRPTWRQAATAAAPSSNPPNPNLEFFILSAIADSGSGTGDACRFVGNDANSWFFSISDALPPPSPPHGLDQPRGTTRRPPPPPPPLLPSLSFWLASFSPGKMHRNRLAKMPALTWPRRGSGRLVSCCRSIVAVAAAAAGGGCRLLLRAASDGGWLQGREEEEAEASGDVCVIWVVWRLQTESWPFYRGLGSVGGKLPWEPRSLAFGWILKSLNSSRLFSCWFYTFQRGADSDNLRGHPPTAICVQAHQDSFPFQSQSF